MASFERRSRPTANQAPAEPDDYDLDFRPQVAAKLGIVVVNRDEFEEVEACLACLAPQLELNDARVVVVDVSAEPTSADRVAALLEMDASRDAPPTDAWKSRASLIRARPCRNNSAGLAVALEFLRAENYLFLHASARLRAGAVSALLDAANEVGVAAAAPLIAGGPDAGLAVARFGDWPLDFWTEFQAAVGRPFPMTPPDADFARRATLDCLVVRGDALEAIGGFDSMLGEPFAGADLVRRLRRSGKRVAYAPTAHVEFADDIAAMASPRDAKEAPAFFADRARFYRKSGPRALAIANLAWRLGRAIARVKNMAGLNDRHTHHKAMDRARGGALRGRRKR
ncbi:MAG: hypothetical protein GC152_01085 [Alphaproteobacteria bacterium]|nr:hypothetical protein [Alphaproteobacteria bacterium]